MKKFLFATVVIIIILCFTIVLKKWNAEKIIPTPVTTFLECVSVGGVVMGNYPKQCTYTNQTFTEKISNNLEKTNLIRLYSPLPNQAIKSPITVTGEARGYWFFEASFPVIITNSDGIEIGHGIAHAKKDWMTEDFVPFEATIEFKVDKNTHNNKGTLILKKDNPSGLSKNNNALEVPILLTN